ncbi:MAG: Clp protease N-terminal domain-containing protein, partial [Gemmatimonadaceae bacterium]
EESARLGHEYVGTEHILLALTRQSKSVALTVMTNLSIDIEAVQRRIDETVKRGSVPDDIPERPYTSRAKKVLELAMSEARDLNHNRVGTEHLLLGLVREEKGIAAQVLLDAGLTLDAARKEVQSVLGVTRPDEERVERGDESVVFVEGRREQIPQGFTVVGQVLPAGKRQITFVALWWTLGIVALIESARLLMRGLAMPEGTSVALVSVAVLEAVGAVLFLAPRTLKVGAVILLGVFAAGFIGHVFRGQFLTQFLVYAAATLFIVASRYSHRALTATVT